MGQLDRCEANAQSESGQISATGSLLTSTRSLAESEYSRLEGGLHHHPKLTHLDHADGEGNWAGPRTSATRRLNGTAIHLFRLTRLPDATLAHDDGSRGRGRRRHRVSRRAW